jgi:hypothetical protein
MAADADLKHGEENVKKLSLVLIFTVNMRPWFSKLSNSILSVCSTSNELVK